MGSAFPPRLSLGVLLANILWASLERPACPCQDPTPDPPSAAAVPVPDKSSLWAQPGLQDPGLAGSRSAGAHRAEFGPRTSWTGTGLDGQALPFKATASVPPGKEGALYPRLRPAA
ncbi:hypothetical protein CB1_002272001 [Camelus ferus]|nr:hypothetical protein CB1_002272001 [Camelus ferus]